MLAWVKVSSDRRVADSRRRRRRLRSPPPRPLVQTAKAPLSHNHSRNREGGRKAADELSIAHLAGRVQKREKSGFAHFITPFKKEGKRGIRRGGTSRAASSQCRLWARQGNTVKGGKLFTAMLTGFFSGTSKILFVLESILISSFPKFSYSNLPPKNRKYASYSNNDSWKSCISMQLRSGG